MAAALFSLSLLLTAAAAHRTQPFGHKNLNYAKRGSGYSLSEDLSGDSFFDAFNFAGGSENGGIANYVSEEDAKASKLAYVGKNAVYLAVDSSSGLQNGMRNAVKLTSKKTYNTGTLVIADVARQPQVCGVWPALWFTSASGQWPVGGELDLLEYVNKQSAATFSAHTSEGCSMTTSGYTGVQMLAGATGLDCNPLATNAQGCGIRSKTPNSTGVGSNSHGGGVYAMELADSGVSMWFFPRNAIPSDISSEKPNPSSWHTPDFHLASSQCDISSHFYDLMLIINTNLCGTWTNGVWNQDNSYAGQPGSCASATGYDTCEAYVAAKGKDFAHAYWKINSIKTYN